MYVTQHGKHEKEENKRALIAAVLAASAGFYALLLFVCLLFPSLQLSPHNKHQNQSSSSRVLSRPRSQQQTGPHTSGVTEVRFAYFAANTSLTIHADIMLSPTYAAVRSWFFPIGTSVAVNYFREAETKPNQHFNVLSIGCGDPRSILFSLWCEKDNHDKTARYRFLACDHEPAVLARNVVLLTLAHDKLQERSSDTSSVWNIFYHLFIPDSDLELLQEHAEKLVAVSESLQSWDAGPFSDIVTFSSEETLSSVRMFWSMYAATRKRKPAQARAEERRARGEIVAS